MPQTQRLARAPLHRQIAAILRDEIRTQYQSGDRLPPEASLAERFEVSTLTLREALSALAQEGLVERRHGAGTFVRAARETRHIAVLSELELQPGTPSFFARVAEELLAALAERNREARLYVGRSRHGQPPPALPTCPAFQQAVEAGELACVAVVTMWANELWMEPLRRQGIPIVGSSPEYDWRVTIDYEDMVDQGVAWLARQGLRRVAFVNAGTPGAEDRLAARFRKAARKAGLTVHRSHVQTVDTAESYAGAAAAGAALWKRTKPPEGLLVLDDVLFQDLLFAMLTCGIDPLRDLACITHCNRGNARIASLPVARLVIDPAAFAAAQAELLCQACDADTTAAQTLALQASLEEGDRP